MPTVSILRVEERYAAIYRLRAKGERIQFGSDSRKIAEVVARVLETPLPESIGQQCQMIRRWLEVPPVGCGIEPRPWVPLQVGPAMRLALARAADPHKRFQGDGRGDAFEMQRPEVPDVHGPESGAAPA